MKNCDVSRHCWGATVAVINFQATTLVFSNTVCAGTAFSDDTYVTCVGYNCFLRVLSNLRIGLSETTNRNASGRIPGGIETVFRFIFNWYVSFCDVACSKNSSSLFLNLYPFLLFLSLSPLSFSPRP